MAPVAFSDSQSNVGTVVLIAMLAIAASLLLFGYGVTPALVARWPSATRVLAEGDLFVTTGFAILAASAASLLVILIART